MEIKVTQIRMYQGVPVVGGELVLIQVDDEITNLKLQADNLVKDWWYYKPIIISLSERIEVGDWMYNHYSNLIRRCEDFDILTSSETWSKILVLPEQFSLKDIQAIVDGNMKDGDKIAVECEERIIKGDLDSMPKRWFGIKLNSDDHVTLHKGEEKVYTREEVLNVLLNFNETQSISWRLGYIKKWFEENVK